MQDKYIRKLLSCKNVTEFITMFFGLSKNEQLSVVGDNITITKGTRFYRVRKDEGKDLTDEQEWWLPPADIVRIGRFNKEKCPVLYLRTEPSFLPREIGLKPNDEYWLATYRAKSHFTVGSFIKNNDTINSLIHKIAMVVESGEKLTATERQLLDTYEFEKNNISEISQDILSPLYINKLLNRELYSITNKLSDLVLQKNKNGIRYCSCYVPIELSGYNAVITLDGENNGNFAITEIGRQYLEYTGVEKKKYTEKEYNCDLRVFIQEIINQKNCNL